MQPTECRLAVIGCRAPENFKASLKNYNCELFEIPENKLLYDSVCTHPDLFVHPMMREGALWQVMAAEELLELSGTEMDKLERRLAMLRVELVFTSMPLGFNYPGNVGLNGVQVGRHLIANPKTLNSKLLEKYQLSGCHLVAVKQGYSKCSVIVIDNEAMITDDAGIAKAAASSGLCVLEVAKGAVELPGMPYGLIGGCCGKVLPEVLLFAGDVSRHPNFDEMRVFAKDRGVDLVWTEGPLTDIGSLFVF